MSSVIVDTVAGILKPISDVIEHLTVSGDAKVALQQAVLQATATAQQQAAAYQQQLLDSQAKIIAAEATGQSWIQRNWRPITMLTFLGLIVARMFDFTSNHITEPEYLQLWSLMKLGLGGYVVGRSAEKIVPGVVTAITAAKQPAAP